MKLNWHKYYIISEYFQIFKTNYYFQKHINNKKIFNVIFNDFIFYYELMIKNLKIENLEIYKNELMGEWL